MKESDTYPRDYSLAQDGYPSQLGADFSGVLSVGGSPPIKPKYTLHVPTYLNRRVMMVLATPS